MFVYRSDTWRKWNSYKNNSNPKYNGNNWQIKIWSRKYNWWRWIHDKSGLFYDLRISIADCNSSAIFVIEDVALSVVVVAKVELMALLVLCHFTLYFLFSNCVSWVCVIGNGKIDCCKCEIRWSKRCIFKCHLVSWHAYLVSINLLRIWFHYPPTILNQSGFFPPYFLTLRVKS